VLPPLSTGFEPVSPSITPALSLILAHAPDLNPLTASVLPLCHESLQVAAPPAGSRPFPALSPQSLCGCLDPYPVAPLQCACSLLPAGQRPHLRGNRFGMHKNVGCNATSTACWFSGLQPFHNVQAPTLARPPGCTYRCTIHSHRAAGPFTPRIARLVTCPEMWYRYVSDTSN
jgi:hypothetical protein